ncbi:MAG: stage V sporulation protein AE [Clostridia bacterium]|nr:stage V sporulation protein AE [Clostridia bacterium]MDD4047685.1 stage V sporulation protein AE [Clostridia bacterium]
MNKEGLINKKRVILVTDGDIFAKNAVEEATRNIGGRCISASAGNPTPISGEKIIEYIKETPYDPVVVMVDDRGSTKKGKGETIIEFIAKHPDVILMGVVAVASNTDNKEGAYIDYSITNEKQLLHCQVNKWGEPVSNEPIIKGDTVNVLNELKNKVPLVVGVGDLGKMGENDDPKYGAQITTMALQTILDNWKGLR